MQLLVFFDSGDGILGKVPVAAIKNSELCIETC